MGRGKHHIGDFLPPDELARFMETLSALKEGIVRCMKVDGLKVMECGVRIYWKKWTERELDCQN